MTEPFLGEIRAFAFNRVPPGWAMCNGQLLQISQNTALFALLGVTYGGDGKTTFGLPNLQSRAAIGAGQGPGLSSYDEGDLGGEQTVTLNSNTMANHTHQVGCDTDVGGNSSPEKAIWSRTGRGMPSPYSSDAPTVAMSGQTVQPVGGNQPHNNMPPYLTLNFCIALQGVFPQRP